MNIEKTVNEAINEIDQLRAELFEQRELKLKAQADLAATHKENEELKKVTEALRIQGLGDGKMFKPMLTKARQNPAYWTEYCELIQEELDATRKHLIDKGCCDVCWTCSFMPLDEKDYDEKLPYHYRSKIDNKPIRCDYCWLMDGFVNQRKALLEDGILVAMLRKHILDQLPPGVETDELPSVLLKGGSTAFTEFLKPVREKLIKLSTLGNGERPGNSVGNTIAQETLAYLDSITTPNPLTPESC